MTSVSPMLATIGSELPHGADWVFEPKYDGIRILAFAADGQVALVSRNGLDKTHQFPEVADALRTLVQQADRPFIVDGEIVALRGDDPARFQDLQSRMHVNDPDAIATHRAQAPAAVILFDMLLDGSKSLVTESWRVRRKHLAGLLQPPGRSSALRLSDVSDDGAAMLETARHHAWEGIIAKRADAPYDVGRRSRAWLKLKINRQQEFVVGGWTDPRLSRTHLGAILLGYYDREGRLVYAGHTGTGFTNSSLVGMHRRLQAIEQHESPFSTTPRTNEAPHWTRPEIVVEIKFNEWTADGHLRHPVFLGVRDDKDPRDVVREPTAPAPAGDSDPDSDQGRVRAAAAQRVAASVKTRSPRATPSPRRARGNSRTRDAERVAQRLQEIEQDDGSGVLELPTGTLEVSKLGKVFFASGHTKGDIMRFYARVSPFLLPAIEGRPLVMKRFPNGVHGKAFYQQKAPDAAPSSVRAEPVSDEGIEPQMRLIGGALATLLYLVQLGAISVDPWHSRTTSIEDADYAIIDLDPGPRAPFRRVVEVAHAVKDVLDRRGLHGVPKTSGASGLHIALPLGAHVPNDGARMIAELVATEVAEQLPRIATIERWVKSRPSGAVYVDFLQNIRGKTVAGVYSVRARPTPTVSTPLTWDEVNEHLDPSSFTIDTVPARLERVGDLWGNGMKKPNSLRRLVARG